MLFSFCLNQRFVSWFSLFFYFEVGLAQKNWFLYWSIEIWFVSWHIKLFFTFEREEGLSIVEWYTFSQLVFNTFVLEKTWIWSLKHFKLFVYLATLLLFCLCLLLYLLHLSAYIRLLLLYIVFEKHKLFVFIISTFSQLILLFFQPQQVFIAADWNLSFINNSSKFF